MQTRSKIVWSLLCVVLCSIIFVGAACIGGGGGGGGGTGPGSTEWEVVYASTEPMGCCKENCHDAVQDGLNNCANTWTRVVASVNVQGSEIKVVGTGRAFADTTNDNGTVRATLNGVTKSQPIQIYFHEGYVPQQAFQIDFTFDSQITGTLTVETLVSDWCTTVETLTVSQR